MIKQPNRNLAAVLRDEMYMKDRITNILEDGPRTIPEIAAELNYPAADVTRWVMAMRRYGSIVDLPKSRADDYYQYGLAEVK